MPINEIMNVPPDADPIELPVKIVWTRGVKNAETQYKKLSKNCDTVIYDEKFQVNTSFQLDPETNLPITTKYCQLSVQLDESQGYKEIANVTFDMADFRYGKYKSTRVHLQQNELNTEWNFDPTQCYMKIGLKGTVQDRYVENLIDFNNQKVAHDFDPSASPVRSYF